MCVRRGRKPFSIYFATVSFFFALPAVCCLVVSAVAQELPSAAGSPVEITIEDPLPAELGAIIPKSVSWISPEYVTETGATDTGAILNRIPNVTWSGGTSRPRFIFMRGIGDLDQYVGSGLPAVTILNDGFNLSGIGNGLSLFDTRLASIERGPTGFFGGPSSLAGLISFESARYESIVDAGMPRTLVEGKIGSGGLRSIGARSIIGDAQWNGVVTVERNHRDGFVRNAFLGRNDTNHLDSTIARVHSRYRIGAKSSVEMNALTVQNDDGYDAFTIDNTRTTRSDKPGADDLGLAGGALASTLYLTDQLRWDSSASVMHADSTYSYDGDWGNDAFWSPYLPYDYFSITDRDRDLLSGETKLTYGSAEAFLAQIGLYGQRLSESVDQADFAGTETYRTLESDFGDTRLAVHGAVSSFVCDTVRMWAAGRRELQRARLSSDSEGSSYADAVGGNLGQVGLQYYITSEVAPYVKFSRGWRGGGYNVGAAVPEERIEYAPEYLNEVATGIRYTFQEGQGFVDLAGFYGRRQNQQVRLELQTDPTDPLSFVYITDNAARGRTAGVEVLSRVMLAERLSLDLSGALLDAQFSEFEGGRAELSDRDAALAPNWRSTAELRYQISDRWFTRFGAVSSDGYYFDDAHDDRAPSSTLVNASVGYEIGGWSIVAWAHNLFDRRYAVRGFYFGNEPPDFEPKRYIQRGEPLSGGVTVSYSF